VISAVISSVVAGLVAPLFGGDETAEAPAPGLPGPSPADTGSESEVGQALALSALEFLVLWLLWFALWGRRRRGKRLLISAGLAVGVVLVNLLVL
jgi:hypothetical protein